MNLENKNVIITGAASGLGKRLAQTVSPLAKLVIAVDRNKAGLNELKKHSKGKIKLHITDLSDQKSLEELFRKLSHGKTQFDILINCAGVGSHKKINELTYKEIQNLIAINTVAPLALTAYLCKNSLLSKGALIVNIGSVSGDLVLSNLSLYSASKSALHTFTRSATIELKKYKINSLLVILGSLKDTNFGKDLGSDLSNKFKFYDKFRATSEKATHAIESAIYDEEEELIYPSYLKIVFFFERHCPKILNFIKSAVYKIFC